LLRNPGLLKHGCLEFLDSSSEVGFLGSGCFEVLDSSSEVGFLGSGCFEVLDSSLDVGSFRHGCLAVLDSSSEVGFFGSGCFEVLDSSVDVGSFKHGCLEVWTPHQKFGLCGNCRFTNLVLLWTLGLSQSPVGVSPVTEDCPIDSHQTRCGVYALSALLAMVTQKRRRRACSDLLVMVPAAVHAVVSCPAQAEAKVAEADLYARVSG
jgi:hypothetical protein